MASLEKFLQFVGWPVACGILVAIVAVQFQQLQRLEQRIDSLDDTPVVEAEPEPSFAEAIAKASASVVGISAARLGVESVERTSDNQIDFYLEERESLGSGIVINNKGFILTNHHVIDNFFDAFDTAVTVRDGRRIPATVVAWDEANDLAVLHINLDDLTPISIGDEEELRVGDIVFAIGYPRNIGLSVSQGIISALTRGTNSSISRIQTDAAINPGNSGGALINRSGDLVGVNSSIFSESGNFEGIGFATPITVAVTAAEEMVAGAIEANSGYLGVITGEALDATSSELFFGVNNIRGMLVESVEEGGAAARAGIRPGDVITRVEETAVTDGENIVMEVRNRKPGDTILVEVYRNGETFSFPTTLGFGQAIVFDPGARR